MQRPQSSRVSACVTRSSVVIASVYVVLCWCLPLLVFRPLRHCYSTNVLCSAWPWWQLWYVAVGCRDLYNMLQANSKKWQMYQTWERNTACSHGLFVWPVFLQIFFLDSEAESNHARMLCCFNPQGSRMTLLGWPVEVSHRAAPLDCTMVSVPLLCWGYGKLRFDVNFASFL